MIARAARRLFAAILRCYPPRFRARYGDPALELYTDLLRDAEARGTFTLLRVAASGLFDALRRSAFERRREAHASRRREGVMTAFLQDLRFALRGFSRQPATAALAVGMIALGVAANVAVFTLLDGIFLRPLPFPDSERLVYLNETAPKWDLEFVGINFPDFAVWREHAELFEGMALHDSASVNLSAGGRTERIEGMVVTHELLSVLGLQPALGRGFTAEEDVKDGPRVVMLAHGLWQEWFGGDPSIVGSAVQLDGEPYEVVGVLPAGLRFPEDASFWMPMQGDPDQPFGSYGGGGVARLRPGATLESARADLLQAHEAVWAVRDEERAVSPLVLPLRERYVSDYRRFAVVLGIGVGVVLLVACANVASLTLARTIARRGEIGLRVALGVSGPRLARQLFTESLMLSIAGGLFGLLLGVGASRAFAAAASDQLPVWASFDFDYRVAGFAVAVTTLTAILFGWAPMSQARRGDLRSSLDSRGRAGGHRSGAVTLRALVIAEIALASLLLVGGGLVLRGLERLRDTDPGWDPTGVVSFRLALPEARYPEDADSRAFWARLFEGLGALPGVESVGAVTCPPLDCHWGNFLTAEDQPPRAPDEPTPVVLQRVASSDYLETLRIPLVRGRTFDSSDRAEGTPVLVVNESFAKLYWPNEPDPIGKRVRFGTGPVDDETTWYEVIGVTRDILHYGLDKPARPGLYRALEQSPQRWLAIAVRGTVAGDDLLASARQVVRELDPELPLFDVGPMSAALDRSLALRRLHSWLVSVFAATALLLAAGGTYGVISYSVTQRRREIGIRSALGASRGRVLRDVLATGLRPVALGMVLGFAGAALAGRALSASLYGVGDVDPLTFAVVAALLFSTGLVAAGLRARRAVALDPSETLREE